MKKLFILILVVTILITGFNLSVQAYDTVEVYVNNELLITDQPAITVNGRTMVPLRAICEALNCVVTWDETDKIAQIENEATIISIQIDNYFMSKLDVGDQGNIVKIELDVPPIVYNDRTLVPARAIAEALYAQVDWNDAEKRVDITLEFDYIGWFRNGYAKVKKNDKFGYINEKREITVPIIYDNIVSYSKDGYVTVQNGNKFGLSTMEGTIVIPIEYDEINIVANGYVTVKQNGKWGFSNMNGKIIADTEYDMLWYFTEDFAVVGKGGKWGHIDTSGNVKVPIIYDSADQFCEGFARVEQNGKWGFVNGEGKVVVPIEYDMVFNFSNGVAKVKKDGKVIYINKVGETVNESYLQV